MEGRDRPVRSREGPQSAGNGIAPGSGLPRLAPPSELAPGEDPRKAFADWLVSPQNPWFTQNVVNRVWFWLLGRGIIQPADDIRPDNAPANPELLAFLEQDLIAARYDLKHLYRQILNSTTYQLSCIPRSDDPGEKRISHAAHSAGWTPRC